MNIDTTNKNLDLFTAFLLISSGIVFALFHQWFGKSVADLQYRYFKIRYSPKNIAVAYLIGGLFFILFGVALIIKQ